MEKEEEEDMHMCLVCHRTIKGLINYVNHKKNECSGKKSSKGEVPQVQSTTNPNSCVSRHDQPFLPQKYSTNHQFETTFTEYSGTPTTHGSLIDFETGQFTSQSVDGVNKNSSLDNVLYTDPHNNPVKSQALFEQQVAAANMAMPNSQNNLDLHVPTPLNLSPSYFRPDHATLPDNSTVTAGLHEDHGLLDGCINGEHLQRGYGTDIGYPGLNPNTVPQANSPEGMPDIISGAVNKEEDNQSRHASEKVDDFFQSLELMSKTAPRAEKGTGFGQPLANLPISNILSNLTFSSDEEEFSFDFADDVSFDSLSDDSDVGTGTSMIVENFPSTCTSLRNRPKFRGKWPPGQSPAVHTFKHTQKQAKSGKKFPPETFKKGNSSGKVSQPSEIKTFTCSVCDVTFSCRFKYSNHFGSQQHKENLLKKRENESETRRPFKSGKGKSFKLIREINKQYENDPFQQSFTEQKPESSNRDTDPTMADKQGVDTAFDSSKNKTGNAVDPEKDSKYQDGNQDSSSQSDTDIDGTEGLNSEVKENLIVKPVNEEDNETKAENPEFAKETSIDNDTEDDSVRVNNTTEDAESRHVEVPLHICTICDRKYPNKYYLSRHLITTFHKHKAMSQPEEAFKLLLQYHKYIIRLSPYQCAICRYYFNSYEEFLKHLESSDHMLVQDNLVAEMICSLCKFRTHYNEELLQHMKTEQHMTNIRKRAKICIIKESHVKCKCKYCDLTMNSYTRLKRHVALKHMDKEFVSGVVKRQIGVRNRPSCSICAQEFSSKSTLELHFRRRHTKERPYNCEVCHKEFADRHAYKGHLRTSRHLKKMLDYKTANEENNVENEYESNLIPGDSVSDNTDKMSYIKIESTLEEEKEHEKSGNIQEVSLASHSSTNISEPTENVHGMMESYEKSHVSLYQNFRISSKNFDKDWVPMKQKPKIKTKIKLKVKDNAKAKRKRRQYNEPGAVRDKTYKCNHCSYTVTAYNDLRPHYLKEHAAQTTICELCDIVFLSDKAMKLHILSKEHQKNINSTGKTSDTDIKYFDCHICKKKFTDEKYCKFHTAYQHFHITTEEGLIKEYGEENSITRQKYKHILREIEPLLNSARVECPECKVGFKKPNFLEHLRIHTGEKPFKCKMCPKAFMASVTLRKHLLGHFGCQERTCEICNKHFKKAASYEEHMQVHEAQKVSQEKMHVCDTCGLSFYLAKQLQNHIRRHRDREFKCTVPGCHWRFLFANELKYHMRSHSQQKPFLCDICGYAASSKCRLTRHRRTHTGERNYHCEYCSYKAGNSTHLHRHMRIHIGSKPFKCPYCEYSCNTHENMRKHIIQTKKHVGLKIYPCKFCDYGTNSCAEFRNHLMENHEKEFGPDIKLMSGLSKYTGLYVKDQDPKQPKEGNKIHQVRERTPRVKKNSDQNDSNRIKKDKVKDKSGKNTKTQNSNNEIIFMDVSDVPDMPVLDSSRISTINNAEKSNTIEIKSSTDFDKQKIDGSEYKGTSETIYTSSQLERGHYVSACDRPMSQTEPKIKNTRTKHPSVQVTTARSSIDNCYDESPSRTLGFGNSYSLNTAEVTSKQNVMSVNNPINYRSLLKSGTITNIPLYQTYSAYPDQPLHGNPSHEYNGSFASNQVHLYHSNREESIGIMAENLHRNEMSPLSYSSYINKRLRSVEEEREQNGNLIIDLEFGKKHC